ncbi:MAG: hypothetical protein LEGION0398_MBIBDBAK_00163 [Legionellaceae bacterium]
MEWIIDYYDERVKHDIENLPTGLKARYIFLTEKMRTFGANLGDPHTKALGEGLFELRIKSSEGIARAFYCTLIGKHIVVLHSFIKKTEKIPKKELEIAERRLKEVKKYVQK